MAQEVAPLLAVRVENDVLVLTITESEVQCEDMAENLRQQMLAAAQQSGLARVVIDFQHVKYVSSSAFRPLLSLRRTLHEKNGRIVLCGLSNTVGDIFHVTRMIGPNGHPTTLFDMEPDLASALARLRAT